MIFDRPGFLLLALALPVVWLAARRLSRAAQVSWALKAAGFAVLLVALAGPRAEMPVRSVAVALAADTSASMPRESLERSQALLRDLDRAAAGSGMELQLITFGGEARLREVPRDPGQAVVPDDAGAAEGMETDLESAIDLAVSRLPRQGARRILLVSDGNQTRGDALAAALRARAAGVEIFSEPSGGTARLPVELASVSAPDAVFSGERFTVALDLASARGLAVRLSIAAGGREIAAKSLPLQAGENAAALDARVSEIGVNSLDVNLEGEGGRQTLFSHAITVRKPRVLYVAGPAGPSDALLKTLHDAQIEVQQATSFPMQPAGAAWDAVILDDYPAQPLSAEEGGALTRYVSGGGGMIFIGGDRNARIAKEPTTPLDKLLPVRGDPNPAPEQPTALLLVLDKSLSMEGPKIAMVRQAARASIGALRPVDKVGLIAFDKEFRWVLPLSPVSAQRNVDAAVDSIEASGGTRIYPALKAAYDAIQSEPATRKHIILLTDGMSPPGDLPQLEQNAAANQITISTIGVGDDVDTKFLQDIAEATRGKSYFIEDPHKITEIVDDETKDLENTEIVEKPIKVVSVRPVEATDGIDFARAPQLLGFIKTKARPGAETILRAASGEPILVRWQVGLGRTAAFLSDARPRWAAGWVGWHSYGTFWPQLVRDMSRRDSAIRAGVIAGPNGAPTRVTYDVSEGPDRTAATILGGSGPLSVIVTAPDHSTRRVALRETAPDRYEAAVEADQTGLYRVAAADSASPLPQVGFVRQSEETQAQGVNYALLREISRASGGAVNPEIAQLLDRRGDFGRQSQPLWPYWLALALLIDFFELALRKGHFGALLSWVRRLRPAAAPEPARS